MIENVDNYIPIDSCKNGYVYRIFARNGIVGIFNSQDNSFTLSRFKFNSNYLFDEYHWDTGEPFGTVKPIEEIDECPENMTESEALEYLNLLTKIYTH
jgi:hypothetical protein